MGAVSQTVRGNLVVDDVDLGAWGESGVVATCDFECRLVVVSARM